MNWLQLISYFFGGAFLANAIPHVVSGMTGRPFQSPFAKPPGQGLSSSTVNVLWGVINLAVAYVLICQCAAIANYSEPLTWASRPPADRGGWIAATVVFAVGLAAFTIRGPRLRPSGE